MKQITQEWINKAEGDWSSAQREVRARQSPNYDAACFHTQQCAEKYLKGRLEEAGITFSKTHDLIRLLHLVLPTEPMWISLQADLSVLTNYAVDFRYPGFFATKIQAQVAVKSCRRIRKVIRLAFGLPV